MFRTDRALTIAKRDPIQSSSLFVLERLPIINHGIIPTCRESLAVV
jgi:hypothetical protein